MRFAYDNSFEDTSAIVGFEPATIRSPGYARIVFDLMWVVLNTTERNLKAYLHSVDSDLCAAHYRLQYAKEST